MSFEHILKYDKTTQKFSFKNNFVVGIGKLSYIVECNTAKNNFTVRRADRKEADCYMVKIIIEYDDIPYDICDMDIEYKIALNVVNSAYYLYIKHTNCQITPEKIYEYGFHFDYNTNLFHYGNIVINLPTIFNEKI